MGTDTGPNSIINSRRNVMNIFNKQCVLIAATVFVVACSQDESSEISRSSREPGDIMPVPAQVESVSVDQVDISGARPAENNDVKIAEEISVPGVDRAMEAQAMLARKPKRSRETSLARMESADFAAPAFYREIRAASKPLNRENYAHFEDNKIKRVLEHPVSTFSIDVDTGSYANVRRMLKSGRLPAHDAVRTEELVNYFSYDYPEHNDRSRPFALYREIAPSPWNDDTYLLHLGIKGYDIAQASLPAANLVFLVDVSGSMQSANKLGLLKSSLKLLTRQLDDNDRVSIVVYAGASGVVLEPTPGNDRARIMASLESLQAGGSTNGAAGIRLAYAMAEQGFIEGGINRVLLATDGDFNVGTSNIEQLKDLVAEKRKTGISLSTLGFGTGNYNDHLMEQIADTGNGNYAYIDTLNEAQKVLVDEMNSTLLTIARDVKIQLEFNPALVSEYRLVGYENRMLNREDFNNDKVDAGEIGAGHTVTALYEISLVAGKGNRIDPLRYQHEELPVARTDELAFLRIRYKEADSDTSKLLEWALDKNEIIADIEKTSADFRFASAVASFAQELRGGKHTGSFSFPRVYQLAKGALGEDSHGYRSEFIQLVKLAESISAPARHAQLVR